MPKFATLEKLFLIIFILITILAVFLSLFLKIKDLSLALLLANFIVAGIVAVFGSLRVRDEEEEKLFK
jgi:glucan phosphoethanolaminetransferase (alkaline phosphatase superfamily)